MADYFTVVNDRKRQTHSVPLQVFTSLVSTTLYGADGIIELTRHSNNVFARWYASWRSLSSMALRIQTWQLK